jgi:hypothetical protein
MNNKDDELEEKFKEGGNLRKILIKTVENRLEYFRMRTKQEKPKMTDEERRKKIEDELNQNPSPSPIMEKFIKIQEKYQLQNLQELNVLSTQPGALNDKINRLTAVDSLNLDEVKDTDIRKLMIDMIKKSVNTGKDENTSYTYGGFDPIGSVSASIVKTDNGYTVSGERKAFHETNSTNEYVVNLDKDFNKVKDQPRDNLG